MQYQEHTYNANNFVPTYIGNISASSSLRVYPNPSSNRIYILGANDRIDIFDMMGKKVYSENNSEVIDISSLKKGMYFIESGNNVVKIIKQ